MKSTPAQRETVLRIIGMHPEGVTAKVICTETGFDTGLCKSCIVRLHQDGDIMRLTVGSGRLRSVWVAKRTGLVMKGTGERTE